MTRKKKPKNGTDDEHPLFAENTPLDDNGMPLDDVDVEVPEEDVQNMPLDSQSSRTAAEYRHAAQQKSRGRTRVRFNAPPPVKFELAVGLHPEARIRIWRVEPELDQSIPEKLVSQLRNYEELRAYIANEHWRGERAEFNWEVHTGANTWAQGKINFAEQKEHDMSRGPHQQPPQYPYQMSPPYGVAPLPGYPAPQVPAYFVPTQQPAAPQVQQPQPAPQPIQVPPGLDPGMAMLMTALMQQLNDANARNAALQQQVVSLQYNQQAQQAQQAQAPQAQPPPPLKSPIEQLSELSAMAKTVHDFGRQMAQTFSPGDEGGSEPDAPPVLNDDNFPMKVKDFGSVRMVADEEGNVSAPLLANIDKYGGLLDSLIDKVKKAFNDISESRTAQIERQVGLLREAETIANRADHQRALIHHQPQAQQAHPSQPVQPQATQAYAPPPMAQAPVPPVTENSSASEPMHPWQRFQPVAQQPPIIASPESEPEPEPPRPDIVETTAEVAD